MTTSLVAGPVFAFDLCAADVFVFNQEMHPTAFQGDATATLSSMMVTGTFADVVASVLFAMALYARLRSDDSNAASSQIPELELG